MIKGNNVVRIGLYHVIIRPDCLGSQFFPDDDPQKGVPAGADASTRALGGEGRHSAWGRGSPTVAADQK